MTVVALLSYFREPDKFLRDMIRSLPRVGVTHLVALDGAYGTFPGGTAASPVSNHRVIEKTCAKAGIESHHFVPEAVWAGDEVQKRTMLFELAETISSPDDWYFVVDGDEVVTAAPDDLFDRLAGQSCGEAVLWEGPDEQPLRMFFRAERDLRPVGNHYTYGTPDGRVFWGGYGAETEPAVDTGVRVRHRTLDRPDRRKGASQGYYGHRNTTGGESSLCAWCGTQTTITIPFGWRLVNSGTGARAKRAGVCTDHLREKVGESVTQAAAVGYDARPHIRSLIQF